MKKLKRQSKPRSFVAKGMIVSGTGRGGPFKSKKEKRREEPEGWIDDPEPVCDRCGYARCPMYGCGCSS